MSNMTNYIRCASGFILLFELFRIQRRKVPVISMLISLLFSYPLRPFIRAGHAIDSSGVWGYIVCAGAVLMSAAVVLPHPDEVDLVAVFSAWIIGTAGVYVADKFVEHHMRLYDMFLVQESDGEHVDRTNVVRAANAFRYMSGMIAILYANIAISVVVYVIDAQYVHAASWAVLFVGVCGIATRFVPEDIDYLQEAVG